MSDQPAETPSQQTERRADNANPDGRRQSVVDRRSGLDRRDMASRPGKDASGLRRLRGPGRRRPEFNRAAEEGEFTDEQFLFVMAIEAFKRANQKTFPTWTEVLEVIRKLGYRKTQASILNLPNTEDWRESPDTPAMPAKPKDEANREDDEDVNDNDLDALFNPDD